LSLQSTTTIWTLHHPDHPLSVSLFCLRIPETCRTRLRNMRLPKRRLANLATSLQRSRLVIFLLKNSWTRDFKLCRIPIFWTLLLKAHFSLLKGRRSRCRRSPRRSRITATSWLKQEQGRSLPALHLCYYSSWFRYQRFSWRRQCTWSQRIRSRSQEGYGISQDSWSTLYQLSRIP